MTNDIVRDPGRALQDGSHCFKVDGAALVRHTRYVRSVLMKKGVRRCDVADMTQEVFLTAWRVIEEGCFCPRPGRDLDEAIHDWLFGIAWRKAKDYRDLRCWAVEVLRRPPIEPEVETMSEERLDARRVLDLFERVRREDQDLMLRVALGDELQVAAHDLGLTKENGSARLRRGREAFAQIIARHQNHPRRCSLGEPMSAVSLRASLSAGDPTMLRACLLEGAYTCADKASDPLSAPQATASPSATTARCGTRPAFQPRSRRGRGGLALPDPEGSPSV